MYIIDCQEQYLLLQSTVVLFSLQLSLSAIFALLLLTVQAQCVIVLRFTIIRNYQASHNVHLTVSKEKTVLSLLVY